MQKICITALGWPYEACGLVLLSLVFTSVISEILHTAPGKREYGIGNKFLYNLLYENLSLGVGACFLSINFKAGLSLIQGPLVLM